MIHLLTNSLAWARCFDRIGYCLHFYWCKIYDFIPAPADMPAATAIVPLVRRVIRLVALLLCHRVFRLPDSTRWWSISSNQKHTISGILCRSTHMLTEVDYENSGMVQKCMLMSVLTMQITGTSITDTAVGSVARAIEGLHLRAVTTRYFSRLFECLPDDLLLLRRPKSFRLKCECQQHPVISC